MAWDHRPWQLRPAFVKIFYIPYIQNEFDMPRSHSVKQMLFPHMGWVVGGAPNTAQYKAHGPHQSHMCTFMLFCFPRDMEKGSLLAYLEAPGIFQDDKTLPAVLLTVWGWIPAYSVLLGLNKSPTSFSEARFIIAGSHFIASDSSCLGQDYPILGWDTPTSLTHNLPLT